MPKEIAVPPLAPFGRIVAGFMGDELPMGASLHPTMAGGPGENHDCMKKVGKSWLKKTFQEGRSFLHPSPVEWAGKSQGSFFQVRSRPAGRESVVMLTKPVITAVINLGN